MKLTDPGVLFRMLMALAFMAAGLVLAYFMHLKYERRTLLLSVLTLLCVLIMIIAILPDSTRTRELRPKVQTMGDQTSKPGS